MGIEKAPEKRARLAAEEKEKAKREREQRKRKPQGALAKLKKGKST